VHIGAARAQILPRLAVQLRDIRVGDPARLVLDTVELAADVRSLLGGRIEHADVRVSDSRIDMPLPFGLPGPTNTAAGTMPAAAVRIVSIRSIALRNVRLRSRGREIAVSADSSLDGNTLALRRFAAEAGGTTLAADGSVMLSPRIDARLNATANRLDADDLVALAAAFAPESTGRPAARSRRARIVAEIGAEQATAGGVQMRHVTTQLTLDGDAIALNRLGFETFDGRYEGSVTARLGAPLSATLESRTVNLDVAQLAAFGGVPDTITGRLSAAGTFRGSGADVAELLRESRGNGTATIVDGSITRLHLVRTVVLFFGRPAPGAEAATDRFDRLDVTFSLADRVLRAQAFSLRSPDADIAGTGTLNLDTEMLDGRADILLSEGLSAQAGTDLYRYTREGNRVVLPASIGGTLAAPRLTIDAAAAARRGLRNEIERRLKGWLEGFGR
jgi:uncharacterized protein involved in outer membrane biogenesis